MRVFIGCSSSDELDLIFYREARKIASYLASSGYDLLIGGLCGVMSVVTEEFANKKRNVSVMEAKCYRREDSYYKYPVVDHDTIGLRKLDLIKRADLIVFMPGGIGTLDEIFSSIESKRALEHDKEIIILNIDGYYDNLIKLLDNMYVKGFANVENKKVYSIVNGANEFISNMDRGVYSE